MRFGFITSIKSLFQKGHPDLIEIENKKIPMD